MDNVESIYRVRNTGRSNSNIWRGGGREGFSSSYKEEDDEEALKWAALEKLPTYSRLRKGILAEEQGELKEIDVKNIGLLERKKLLGRLVHDAEEDNEKFLKKLKQRIDRVGIHLPTIEVRFQHLSVEAEAHVGGRALPSVLNFMISIIEGLLGSLKVLPNKKKFFSILHDVSGIIKPGRLTLLLGPPSSGKTTLLLAMAGKLNKDLKVGGEVTYNGHEMNEFVPQRTAAYISQHDVHIGEMTVRETLAFSARCQGVGPRYEMLAELSRREKEANIKPDPDLDIYMKAAALDGQESSVVTDYVLKILGLDICADTMVGDEMSRGLSGGERKRVTTGEMLVGPAKALFMDEISTGLDSSTTYHIVNSMRQFIHILQGTAVISLLQPPPETYNLFDDILLLSDGLLVYKGPRENVLEFFESMGFKCPPRKGVADFLQEVTSRKDQEQYWARRDEPYSFVTVGQFAEAFQTFHVGRAMGDELGVPFERSKSHPAALTTKKYGVSRKELFKALTAREYLIMKRNSFVYLFKMYQLIFMAFVTMTVFLRTEMPKDTLEDGTIYMGALFFTVFVIMLNGFSELAMTIMKLPTFYKQRDLLFFPAWIYSIPSWILRIPLSVVQVAIWVFVTYYVMGLDPNVGRLFKMYLLLTLIHQMSLGLFRLISTLGRNMIVANTFGFFVLLLFLVLGGFILSRDHIKDWLIWGYWISPLMYGQNAISVNEFLGNSWRKPYANSTKSLGVLSLENRGIFPQAYWYWIGVGAMFGYIILFNILGALSLTFLDAFDKPQSNLSEEMLEERNACKTGAVELTTRGKLPLENRAQTQRGASSSSVTPQGESTSDADKNKKRGMVLPFEPLSIAFDNVRYSVDMPQEMKAQGVSEDRLQLLKGVSGSFRPGVLTALMGVSGAGKTTLLDVLAGRKTGGYIEGQVTISGYPKKQETFARVSGYCEQTDIHSPHVTVHESLQYSAWLRLPAEVDSATRKMFVDEVMELVELTPFRQALVGLPGVSGLSTEQRKRLTIAVELVANPSIIFMDEPTSGLDARAAAIVMRTVRNTVDTGRTVVCTIHQPSIDIFDAFDELFLLKRGGEEIYVGPIGSHASEMIKYFEGIDGVSKIKDGYNPATWMLEMTSPAQEANLGVDFADIYKNSELHRRNQDLIKQLSIPHLGSKDLHFPSKFSLSFGAQCRACLWKHRRNQDLIKQLSIPPPGSKDLYFPSKFSLSFGEQYRACLWKQYLSYWRNPHYTAVRFLFTTGIAVLIGTLFWDLGMKREKQKDISTAMGSMYIACLFIGVQNAMLVQPVVAVERTVFYRERAAGMYSELPYAFSQAAIEVPYIFVQSLTYGLIIYAMIGFEWTAAKFLWYWLIMFFTFSYFTYYGMMAVAVTPNPHIASVVSTAFYSLWNLFSGFIVRKTRIPIWWKWYYYISPVAWSLYGLIASQFGDVHERIEGGTTVAEYVRDFFGFKHDFVVYCAIITGGFTLLFAVIFAFSIKAFNFQKR